LQRGVDAGFSCALNHPEISSVCVIFRSKFGIVGWGLLANSLFFDLPWIFGSRISLIDKFIGISMPTLLLAQILTRYFVYWILDRESIQEYRFWKRRIIPLSEVLQVSGHGYWNGRPTLLRIDYFRAADAPKSGKIDANPADVYGFLNALRQSAPFAAIDV
jgi:hypothetical protein